MKENKVLKIAIVVLLIVIATMIGWYLGDKSSDKHETIINNQSQNDTVEKNKDTDSVYKEDNVKVEEDLSEYPEWMQYILNTDIKSINIYKWMDQTDANFIENQNSLYTVEITRDELKEIFNQMKNGEMRVVMGRGGTEDYLKISYIIDNKNYDLTFRKSGFIDNSNVDETLNNLLRKENKQIVDNMSDEMKELYGSDPIPNFINWNSDVIYNYFDNHTLSTYYY